jgi:hypothetical protein
MAARQRWRTVLRQDKPVEIKSKVQEGPVAHHDYRGMLGEGGDGPKGPDHGEAVVMALVIGSGEDDGFPAAQAVRNAARQLNSCARIWRMRWCS